MEVIAEKPFIIRENLDGPAQSVAAVARPCVWMLFIASNRRHFTRTDGRYKLVVPSAMTGRSGTNFEVVEARPTQHPYRGSTSPPLGLHQANG